RMVAPPAAAPAPTPPPPRQRPARPGKPVVLVVEDNPDSLRAARALLQESWQVIEAQDGRAGVEQARAHQPDLILMDIALPVHDGVRAFQEIRQDEKLRHIPIIALTEQKNLEAQFLRAQRLEALGTLASGIAHDLNNILAPIRMVAPLLRDAQTPAELAENVDLIETSTQRASDVVRQLLAFGRGGSGERMALELKHMLRELRRVILETFPKNIIFVLSEAPDLWPLVADPTQLHQVLLNLCINARDAMPEGGTLKLTAINFSADEHFAGMVAGARPGAYALLQVSDTGTGIPPEHLGKIFDPFFTTKAEGRGTGLGLAVVYTVATNHGGFVQVRSQVGKGTTFEVYLPASPAALVHDEPALPCSLLDGHGELILVVDDEESIRQITEKTLARHGYRVLTARDGTEAVVLFAPRQNEIKAVVTDLMMPGMDGLELVKVLAELAPALPVVVSTGGAGVQALDEKLPALRQFGVRNVLTKPYATEQLLKALHAVIFPIQ
ncbi:MAG: response regulator, partial [Verrucomicrobia bacterium]|nr:response regulator [Verrucomicrobiota bacterium]